MTHRCYKCRRKAPAGGFGTYRFVMGKCVHVRQRGVCGRCPERFARRGENRRARDLRFVQQWIHQFVASDTQCQNYLMARSA